MTEIESALKRFERASDFNDCRKRTLCKYYNDDESRDPDIPDILDYLYDKRDTWYDELDNANDNITGIQKEIRQYANCPSVVQARSWDLKSAQFQIKSCEEQVSAITKLIDLVENERAEYYYLYENNQVLSIKTAEYPVLTPTTVNGKLIWNDTGVKIEVYEVPCFDSDDIKALVPSNKNPEMYDTVTCRYELIPYFKNVSFKEGKSYVGFEGVKDLDPDSFYITCVNCKRIFALTKKHQEWYTVRRFSLPKRCSTCREEKRIKEYEDDASTSFFAWD